METMAVVQRDISKPWWNLRRNSDWNHLRCSEGNANIKIPLGEIAGGTPREIQKEAPGEISKELWETIEDEFLQKSREKFLKKSRKVQEDVWKKQSQENHNERRPAENSKRNPVKPFTRNIRRANFSRISYRSLERNSRKNTRRISAKNSREKLLYEILLGTIGEILSENPRGTLAEISEAILFPGLHPQFLLKLPREFQKLFPKGFSIVSLYISQWVFL